MVLTEPREDCPESLPEPLPEPVEVTRTHHPGTSPRFQHLAADARVRSTNVLRTEPAMSAFALLILLVLAVVGLLFLGGLIALIGWSMRRTQVGRQTEGPGTDPVSL
jgi:hypothetical protein